MPDMRNALKRALGTLFALALFAAHVSAQTAPVPLGPSGGGGGGGITVGSPIIGTCPSGDVVYSNSGLVGCEVVSGTGTVTSVGFTGGLLSVATPTTTPAFTVAGTSGGIPYFASSSTWASSAALAANALVVGGGAGAAPSTVTTGANVLTALGAAINATTGLPNVDGAIVTGNCLKWGPGVQDAGATCGGTTYTAAANGGLTLTGSAFSLGDGVGISYTFASSSGQLALLGAASKLSVANAGAAATPSISVGNATTGFFSASTTGLCFADVNSTCEADYGITNANVFTIPPGLLLGGGVLLISHSTGNTVNYNGGVYGFASAALTTSSNPDVLISRISAGLMAVGTTTQGSVAGRLESSAFISASTVPTSVFAGGTCAGGSLAGGGTAGTATLTGACAATNTWTLSVMPTTTTGYACTANDRTTPAAILQETSTSATTAVFTFSGTTGATDVIQYHCIGY